MFIVYRKLTEKCVNDLILSYSENISPSSAEVTMTPSTETALDKETAEKFIRMINLLEDLDDVQNVYHNAQIPEDLEM